jgi:hypothetical protein
VFDALSVYGVTPQAASYGVAAPTQQMATDDITSGWKGLIDPNNPLMWFGVVLLITVGAAGVAGSVRLGRARVGVNVDQA